MLNLNSTRTLLYACFIVPLFCGLFSLFLGADSNWDLYNYHMYAPFALMHDKSAIDLAPASFQGYFNPLLDLATYWLNTHLPSRLAGFLFGVFHGLAFIPILGVVRHAIPQRPDRNRVALMLAIAGCLTPNFFAAIGNGMGDNTTAVFCLVALYLLISNWTRIGTLSGYSIGIVGLSGFLAGVATGFKLTNTVFAIGMCLALLLVYSAPFLTRLRISFLFGVGVLFGIAATGGYWMWQMWVTFGNPLFPQFSTLFPGPLTAPIAVSDMRWRPQSLLETVLWPFLFSLNSHRVGEASVKQFLWPVVYALFWIWAVVFAYRKTRRRAEPLLNPIAVFVLAFCSISYVVWLEIFSIYRYIGVIEVLLPLLIFILLDWLRPYEQAKRISAWVITASTILLVVTGLHTWGHEGWADPLYHADTPAIAEPERTTVLVVSLVSPLAWLATFFPPTVSFIGIESGFPQSDAFMPRVEEIIRSRGGPVYVMTDAEDSSRMSRLASYAEMASAIGFTRNENTCAWLRSVVSAMKFKAIVVPSQEDGRSCDIALRPQDRIDFVASNRARAERASETLQRNGFSMNIESCKTYEAGIGTGVKRYQYCEVQAR